MWNGIGYKLSEYIAVVVFAKKCQIIVHRFSKLLSHLKKYNSFKFLQKDGRDRFLNGRNIRSKIPAVKSSKNLPQN